MMQNNIITVNNHRKANKGEWSEFYTLLKLLDESKLYLADKDLNKLYDQYYPIVKIITAKNTVHQREYNIEENNDEITVVFPIQEKNITISRKLISSSIDKFYDAIIKGKSPAFEIPIGNDIMDEMGGLIIKSAATEKADIYLILKDKEITTEEMGFSIKSQIGSPSTLLNTSDHTRFIFKVNNFHGDLDDINSIDSKSKVRDRIHKIELMGGSLEFSKVDSPTFQGNLLLIESRFPFIMGEILKIFYSGKGNRFFEILPQLINSESLHIPLVENLNQFYKTNIQHFLLASALGMMPSIPWNSYNQVNGGYIIVKRNGEVVSYYISKFEDFAEYLFNNTKLDTPSTTRHKFGTLYRENNEYYFKLSLQIRFIN